MANYQIKSGDTLSGIALANNTTVANLQSLNNITDPNKIYAGQSINLSAAPAQTAIGANTMNSTQTPANFSTIQTGLDDVMAKLKAYQASQVAVPPAQSMEQQQADIYKQQEKDFNDMMAAYTKPTNPLDDPKVQGEQAIVDARTKDTIDKQAAVKAEQSKLGMINAQLQGYKNEQLQKELKLREEGISEGAATGRSLEMERNNAIRSIPLQTEALIAQAKIASAQGDLEYAQQLQAQAEDKFNLVFKVQSEYTQALADFENKKIDAVYQFATNRQKEQLDALRTKQQNEFTMQQNNINNAQDLANELFQYDKASAAKITKLLQNPGSPTFNEELANIQAQAMQNPEVALDLSLKQAQLAQTKAQTSKIYSDANNNGPGGTLSANTQAVIDNPSLLDNYTPTLQQKVIAELQAAGYDTSNLGVKGLSDTAIGKLTQSQGALASLGDLKSIILNNKDKLGPITGLEVLNPWSEKKKIQSDIDRVRQVVGKALEGGVLRKEDEEKYKKILATITDVPSTALYKIDQLIADVNRDIQNYTSMQASSGRSADIKGSLQKTGATSTTGQTSGGNSYTITKE